jgi:taurine dioxygenase
MRKDELYRQSQTSQIPEKSNFHTEPIGAGLGESIRGVKLEESLTHKTVDQLINLLNNRQVLCFHDHELQLDELREIARIFGKPQVHPIWTGMSDCPEVIRIAKLPGEEDPLTNKPMTIASFFEIPSKFVLIYCDEQGDSCCDYQFTSLTKAYEGLSKPMQEFLGDLKAVHSPKLEFGPENRKRGYFQGQTSSSLTFSDALFEQREHPLVHVHAETGRKCLYLNEAFTRSIVGLGKEESDCLLKFLFAHCARPEFGCRIPVRSKSLIVFDNRVTTQMITRASLGQSRILYAMIITNEERLRSPQDCQSPTKLLI